MAGSNKVDVKLSKRQQADVFYKTLLQLGFSFNICFGTRTMTAKIKFPISKKTKFSTENGIEFIEVERKIDFETGRVSIIS